MIILTFGSSLGLVLLDCFPSCQWVTFSCFITSCFFFFSMSCFLNEKIFLLRVVEAKVVRAALRAGSQFNVYLN